jgi:hypothetical protein
VGKAIVGILLKDLADRRCGFIESSNVDQLASPGQQRS